MTYNATYTDDDIAPITIDAIVTGLAVVVSFATLIVLVVLYKWFKKHAR